MSYSVTNKLHVCPVCAKEGLEYPENRKWKCPSCGFTLYNNVAAAVGLIIILNGAGEPMKKTASKDVAANESPNASKKSDTLTEDVFLLCIKRGREPRKGLYALPGGFVDPDETAEQACIRECLEETGLQATSVRFVCSAPNSYEYKNVGYKTCDLFFEATLSDAPKNIFSALKPDDQAEVTDYKLFPVQTEADVDAIPFAFPSASVAVKAWVKMRG